MLGWHVGGVVQQNDIALHDLSAEKSRRHALVNIDSLLGEALGAMGLSGGQLKEFFRAAWVLSAPRDLLSGVGERGEIGIGGRGIDVYLHGFVVLILGLLDGC